jgi:hypothetical protein
LMHDAFITAIHKQGQFQTWVYVCGAFKRILKCKISPALHEFFTNFDIQFVKISAIRVHYWVVKDLRCKKWIINLFFPRRYGLSIYFFPRRYGLSIYFFPADMDYQSIFSPQISPIFPQILAAFLLESVAAKICKKNILQL